MKHIAWDEDMVAEFCLIMISNNVHAQFVFYSEVIGLSTIFKRDDGVGLGINGKLIMIIKPYNDHLNHHSPHHKGPLLPSFRCIQSIDECKKKLAALKVPLRGERDLPEHKVRYLFIEDPEGNEICLRFYYN